MSLYSVFVRNAFLGMLAYRLRYYTGIVTYLLFVSVHYFIWKAVFSGAPSGTTINGFTMQEMVTYVSVGWIARSLYFSTIDEDIEELVRSGQISVYLLRPVNFHFMMLTQAAGESLFRLCFFTLPIGIVLVLVFPISLPVSLFSAAGFALSTFSGFILLAELNFMVGMLAFTLKSTQGIGRAKYSMIQLFSGLLLPLPFFPQWMQGTLELLPFKIISYVPLQFYLGKISVSEAGPIFLNQLIWILVFYIVSEKMWRSASAKLTLQGG